MGSPGNKPKKCLHPSKVEFFRAFPSHKNVLIVSLCVPAQHSFAFLSSIKQVEIKDSHLDSPGHCPFGVMPWDTPGYPDLGARSRLSWKLRFSSLDVKPMQRELK